VTERTTGDDALYRPNVGMMLVNPAGLVFVARRIDTPVEAWQMPQGGIDEGEEPHAAALRELEEEIGTAKAEIIAESRGWFRYDVPTEITKKLWRGRWKGQRQKWFLMRFTGRDEDVDLATRHPEFDAWQWAEPARLPDLIIPFKRQTYRDVLAEFADELVRLRPGSGGRP
jgi:putative (di)nucleoside polyphosphate hydrolase